ncbi:MAG: polymer-forming cytoskeletal protein [Rhodobacterales bacterium]|nr:polymer-forming cytoskeletal protein [Rhodobacterales bacterium]
MKIPHGDLDRWPDPAGANARRSVLAQDLVVEGDVISSGPIDMHGKIMGSMRAPDIVIAGSGRVEGSVVANDLSVLGAVSGMISARNVQLASSAVVHADVSHERIAVEAGAELEGRLQSRA